MVIDCIKRWFSNSPFDLPSSKESEGVITLADENYFQGLLILYHSIQASYPVPIICYDIGLSEEQKRLCKKTLPLLSVLPIPDHKVITKIKNYNEKTTLAKKSKRQWPLWICPYLISSSPFTKTLWLDCDILVLRNLDVLYKKLDKGPIFTSENLAPHKTGNKPELYQLLPIKRSFNEENALINAGVSGWHMTRDKDILQDYKNVVQQAFQSEDIKNAISWHDQGALIWAILNNGVDKNVEKNTTWNQCVKHTAIGNFKFTWSSEMLEEIQKLEPSVNILHWNGQTVPWVK